jgi:hypothetical protein
VLQEEQRRLVIGWLAPTSVSELLAIDFYETGRRCEMGVVIAIVR